MQSQRAAVCQTGVVLKQLVGAYIPDLDCTVSAGSRNTRATWMKCHVIHITDNKWETQRQQQIYQTSDMWNASWHTCRAL